MPDATGLLRIYARYRLARLARQDPIAEQERQLLRLVRRAARTRFGRDHRFAEVRSVADFQQRVPLRRYEDMWREYWRDSFPKLVDCTWPGTVPFFALTSGTTSGTTKYIPCSEAMNRANARAAVDILVHHIANCPRTRVLGGKAFMLGGSTDLVQHAPGIRSGDLSGIAASQIPWWARRYSFPPRDLALIADWEEKVERLAQACLQEDIRAISGTPSWLLVFFDRLFALRPQSAGRLHGVFPNLDLLVHGGVNFAPYRRRFEELLQGSHAELREVYPASEGFFAIADRGSDEGLRLIIDNGLFYEFVPRDAVDDRDAKRCWLADAQVGVDYALVVSNNAGAWAYIVGDTVRLIERNPPRVLVSGRLSYFLSAFGEHLSGEEIELAISAAAGSIGATAVDFVAGAVFPDATDARGGHLYVIEFAGQAPGPPRVARFEQFLDEELCRRNDDYRAHRSGGFGLRPPQALVVRHGAFAAWMRQRGQLGGQHKVPRIVTDGAVFASMHDFMRNYVV